MESQARVTLINNKNYYYYNNNNNNKEKLVGPNASQNTDANLAAHVSQQP